MRGFCLLVAYDQPIFRFGLRSLLGSYEKWPIDCRANRTDGGVASPQGSSLPVDTSVLFSVWKHRQEERVS